MIEPSPSELLAPPGVRALLEGIVDYAGLFPPAALPLETAFPHYVRYRRSREAWMLARFVCPVGKLDRHAFYKEHLGLERSDVTSEAASNDASHDASTCGFAVLGSGGRTADDFYGTLAADLKVLIAFNDALSGRARTDGLEVRLPRDLFFAAPAALASFFDRVQTAIARAVPALRDVFFEVPAGPDMRPSIQTVASALAAHNAGPGMVGPGALRFGFKLRTGGPDAAAFPSPAQVAFVIAACRDAGVPFKATAGLHHPVRRYDASVRASMFGFLNVFGAAVLAFAHALDEQAVRSIVADEDAASFRFTPDAFAWNDLAADLPTVRRARHALAVSFGSCSFEEPVADLHDLGLLG